jgi:hypothetical protein
MYGMYAFASTMSEFLDENNQPINMCEWQDKLEIDIASVQARWRPHLSACKIQSDAGNKWSIQTGNNLQEPWLFKLNCDVRFVFGFKSLK